MRLLDRLRSEVSNPLLAELSHSIPHVVADNIMTAYDARELGIESMECMLNMVLCKPFDHFILSMLSRVTRVELCYAVHCYDDDEGGWLYQWRGMFTHGSTQAFRDLWGVHHITVDAQGYLQDGWDSIFSKFSQTEQAQLDNLPNEVRDDTIEVFRYFNFLLLYTLNIMNSKNVMLRDVEPPPLRTKKKKKLRTRKDPLDMHKRLYVQANKTSEWTEVLDGAGKGLIREHNRRGHFATYTEDAPLFGKLTGQFYRPPTMVGNRQQGTVHKEYVMKVEE